MSDIQIAPNIFNIYKDLKPILFLIAKKYNIPDVKQFVNDWASSAALIAVEFDSKKYDKKVFVDNKLEDYSEAEHSEDLFIKSFKNYLAKAFTNNIIKQFNLKKKEAKLVANFIQPIANEHLTDQMVGISSFKDIVLSDLFKLKDKDMSLSYKVNEIFLSIMVDYCDYLILNFGEISITDNLFEKNNKKFFSKDFREDIGTYYVISIAEKILKETNPLIIEKLSILLHTDKDGKYQALNKKIYRYLFDFHNGFSKRLKVRLNLNDKSN